MKNESAVINYNKIKNLKIFIVNMVYWVPQPHKDFELLYVLEGKLEIRTVRRTLLLHKKEAILINFNLVHELVTDDNVLPLEYKSAPGFVLIIFPSFMTWNLTSAS